VNFKSILDEQEMDQLVTKCKYAYKPRPIEGFCQYASAIIICSLMDALHFAKWGIVTSKEFFEGGSHEGAIILHQEKKRH